MVIRSIILFYKLWFSIFALVMASQTAQATSLQDFSVNEAEMQNAVCKTKLPISDRYIESWIKQKTSGAPNIAKANISGYQFENENQYLLQLFEKLQPSQSNFLQLNVTELKAPLVGCHKVRCALAHLYGQGDSLRLIYLLGEFGYDAVYRPAPKGRPFTSEELDTLTKSFADIPVFLRNAKPNSSIAIFDSEGPMGNMIIQLFKPWTQVEEWKKNYVIFHEVSHNLASQWNKVDKSKAWIELSGWSHEASSASYDVLEPNNFKRGTHPCLSDYACSNAAEYFAEAFSSFRYSPELLLKTNPDIFKFIKKYYKQTAYNREEQCIDMHPEYKAQSKALLELSQKFDLSLKNLSSADPHMYEKISQSCLQKVTNGQKFSFKEAKGIEDKTNLCLDFQVLAQTNIQSDEYTASQLVSGLQPALRLKQLIEIHN